MFKQLDLRVIGGVAIIAVLLLAGTQFFSQRSHKRFVSEIGELPQSTTSSKDDSKNDTITPSEQSKPTLSTESVTENLKGEPKPVVKSEMIVTSEEKEVPIEKTDTSEPESEFDAASLLSVFGVSEEVTSLLDKDADEADFEKAQTHLTEKYGPSPEVEAIIDKLKQMSGGPIELDDLTSLFDAWIQVLPEGQQENRRQLMDALTALSLAKTLGGDGTANISIQVVEPETVED